MPAIEFVGMEQALKALRGLPKKVREEVQKEMNYTAIAIQRGAVAAVPVRTGLLKRAINWESRPRSLSAVVGITNPLTFYWKWLEYGTVKMTARPFLRPTAEVERGKHRQRVWSAIDQVIEKLK